MLLTGAPHCPYRWNSNGEPNSVALTALTCWGLASGSGLPLSFCRRSFGSKESTCETPPSMNRKITDFALGAKCAGRSFIGSSARSLAGAASVSSALSARPPNPFAHRSSACLRVSIRLPHKDEFLRVENHMSQIRPHARVVGRGSRIAGCLLVEERRYLRAIRRIGKPSVGAQEHVIQ